MKLLPRTEDPLVLRTDYSNQAVWEKISAIIRRPVSDFRAYVEFHEDKEYANVVDEDGILRSHGIGWYG